MGQGNKTNQEKIERKLVLDIAMNRNTKEAYPEIIRRMGSLNHSILSAYVAGDNRVNEGNVIKLQQVIAIGLVKAVYSYTLFSKMSLREWCVSEIGKEANLFLNDPFEYMLENEFFICENALSFIRMNDECYSWFLKDEDSALNPSEAPIPDGVVDKLNFYSHSALCQNIRGDVFAVIPKEEIDKMIENLKNLAE